MYSKWNRYIGVGGLSPLKNLPPFKKTKQKNSKILFAIFHFAMCEMISQAKRPRPQSFPVFQHTEIRCNTSPWRHRRKRKKINKRRKATNFVRNSSSTRIENSRKKKKKKMANIRNQKKKKTFAAHTERQPSRFTIKKKKKTFSALDC